MNYVKVTLLKRFSIILIAIVVINAAHAQSVLQQKIDVDIKNSSLVNSIKTISEISKVNFTYDPAILPEEQVTIFFIDQSLGTILNSILSPFNIGFDELSGQIILYKAPNMLETRSANLNLIGFNNGQGLIINKPLIMPDEPVKEMGLDIISSGNQIDTVFVNIHDTVFKTDTITLLKMDTILKIDSIFVEDITSIFDDIYAKKDTLELKPWISIDLLASFQPKILGVSNIEKLGNFMKTDSSYSSLTNKTGYSFMGKVNFQFSHFTIQTGLGYNSMQQEFSVINETQGGYFTSYVKESYYTSIQSQDTIWQHIMAEKWVETYENEKTTATVQYNYLQLPIFMQYSYRLKDISLGISSGIILEIPLKSANNQITFFNNQNESFDTLQLETQTPNYSFLFSLTANYLLNKNLSLQIQPYFYSNLSSIHKNDYWLDQKLWYASVYVGFRYYFNRKNCTNLTRN
ncbi:MAG: hypothetical protein PF517_20650 [Salinivirgaceae bacterium]|jgi:hypothetical protein|nr:hypothetical protein [Salinivirgaceae bacterium]